MFGGLRVYLGEQLIARFTTQKAASLLAYLACHRRETHPREVLIELLWPESEPKAGRASLSQALSSLRRQLEPPGVPTGALLQTTYASVGLNADAVTTDVAAFEMALRLAAQTLDGRERAPLLTQALELYRGELLPGFYEDWVLVEQRRLADLHFQAARRLSACLQEAGESDRALDVARRALSADPLREEAHSDLIRLYAALDQPSAALRQYRELERLLREELGATPCAATRALVERLLHEAPVLAGPNTPSKAQSMRRPQRKEGKPANPSSMSCPARSDGDEDRTIGAEHSILTGYLPPQATRFFGREEEIKRLAEMSVGAFRLITLTGPGGSGKTRLALEVAGWLREVYQGAIWFVPLADLRDARRIPDTIADVLCLPRFPNIEPMEQVVAALSRQPALLLLDNMEHLLAAEWRKSEDGAAVVRALLDRVPSLTCLVTSRQPLGLSGERELPVKPLPTPNRSEGAESSGSHANPSLLVQYPSVALFVDRAQAVKPDFQVTERNAAAVAELCRRLEGIPLTIELAAARAKVLTPAQMLQQLERRFDLLVSRKRDASERHRSLWAAVEWSYRLLSPDLRRFFARLSVFRGSWTLEAAEAVCEEPLALDYLEYLQECSLVFSEETEQGMRFHMLETLREYAVEQLPPAERIAVGRRHAEYFVALVEEIESHSVGWDDSVQVDRQEQEYENLQAAFKWCQATEGGAEMGLRLIGGLRRFWMNHGAVHEARRWLEGIQNLLAASRTAPLRIRARAIYCAVGFVPSHERAHTLLEESVALARASGDWRMLCEALGSLGCNVVLVQGDPARGWALLDECLALGRAAGDERVLAFALGALGTTALNQGDFERATPWLEESLDLYRRIGYWPGVTTLLGELGYLYVQQGNYDRAAVLFEEEVALFRKWKNTTGVAHALWHLANVARGREDYAQAMILLDESLALRRELDDKAGIADALASMGTVALCQGDYAQASQFCQIPLAKAQGLAPGWKQSPPTDTIGRLNIRPVL